MKFKRLSFREFRHIYSRVPRLCVEAVIRVPGQGIVLTQRAIEPANGFWHVPGGVVYKGEKLAEAVRRVAKEEVNARVKVERMLGVIEYSFKGYFGHPIGIAYLATYVSGELKVDRQAARCGIFRTIPRHTVKEQRMFLKQQLRMKAT